MVQIAGRVWSVSFSSVRPFGNRDYSGGRPLGLGGSQLRMQCKCEWMTGLSTILFDRGCSGESPDPSTSTAGAGVCHPSTECGRIASAAKQPQHGVDIGDVGLEGGPALVELRAFAAILNKRLYNTGFGHRPQVLCDLNSAC